MTGTRGPIPKRPEERRRTNAPEIELTTVDIGKMVRQEVEVPEHNPDWHPVAIQWYVSLQFSGQAVFFEPSDWATAYVLAENLSRDLEPQPISVGKGDDLHVEFHARPLAGASLAAFLKGATALLATEGDRRRVSVMLEGRKAGPEGGGKVVGIEDRRAGRLG
jgi:hypothetical protein